MSNRYSHAFFTILPFITLCVAVSAFSTEDIPWLTNIHENYEYVAFAAAFVFAGCTMVESAKGIVRKGFCFMVLASAVANLTVETVGNRHKSVDFNDYLVLALIILVPIYVILNEKLKWRTKTQP